MQKNHNSGDNVMDKTRRKLLKLLFSTPLAGYVARSVLAKSPYHLYPMNLFSVAGFKYYDGPKIINKLKQSSKLTLIAEPDNPHDKYAVKVLYKSRMMGYVPRNDNRHISRLLRQNIKLDCRVIDADPGKSPWKMLNAEVCLVG